MPSTLFNKTTFEQLKATGDLPSPKGAALSIIKLTQNPDISMAELDKAIRADPAFVARLLKAANGVVGYGHRPVVSIRDALAVMGLSAVRGLALGFSLVTANRSGRSVSFDFQHFWSHSLLMALAFQAINRYTRTAAQDEAFSVGLLARIGDLALVTLYPQQYDKLIELLQREPQQDLAQAEHALLSITHSELSAALISDWGFPQAYVDAIYHHEMPAGYGGAEGSRGHALTHSLALAHHIADICLGAPESRQAHMAPLYLTGNVLSIPPDVLMQLCDEVVLAWPEWAQMLDLQYEQLTSFKDLIEAARQQSQPNAPGRTAENPPAPRALVVDADPVARQLLKEVLRQSEFDVIEAGNGNEGFAKAIELVPDTVITDWVMPGMNGVEMVRALRQTKPGSELFIIMLTEQDDEETLKQAFMAGVDDYVCKPLLPRTITARLHSARRLVNLQRENRKDQDELRRVASELAVANRRLQELAITDVLTGFPNRRYALDRMQQEWATSSRRKSPLAFMMIDLDYFKQVNDTEGHDFGDEVLKRSGSAIKEVLRSQDVICRIGGDEFLAICPDTSLRDAMMCAERIRKQVEKLGIKAGANHFGLSIGVAERDPQMQNPDDLVKMADKSVFAAKQNGRNQVYAAQHVARRTQ